MQLSEHKNKCVLLWDSNDILDWLNNNHLSEFTDLLCNKHCLDGFTLLLLTEKDLRKKPLAIENVKYVKKFMYSLGQLKLRHNIECVDDENCMKTRNNFADIFNQNTSNHQKPQSSTRRSPKSQISLSRESFENESNEDETNGNTKWLVRNTSEKSTFKMENRRRTYSKSNGKEQGQMWKCLVSLIYFMVSSFTTCVVMTIAHNRVPDSTIYPPLPDLVLDSLPLITWAFEACEVLILALTAVFFYLLVFHKYRLIILKRYLALVGTIFVMRSVTLFVTTLSVPGKHLNCQPKKFTSTKQIFDRALEIMMGGGMSLNGLRTCGDYMFSGHTSIVTTLVMFITEYYPQRNYWIHNTSCILWGFSIFFILAGHEHYTIDVVCAIYIASRLFHYYHTLITAVNLNRRRTQLWFPICYYLEYPLETAWVPNEFEGISQIVNSVSVSANTLIKDIKRLKIGKKE